MFLQYFFFRKVNLKSRLHFAKTLPVLREDERTKNLFLSFKFFSRPIFLQSFALIRKLDWTMLKEALRGFYL